jgi:hypothetical protein
MSFMFDYPVLVLIIGIVAFVVLVIHEIIEYNRK